MQTRIILAALAVATLALSTPVEAKKLNSRATAASTVDVAAIPPYPLEAQNSARHGGRQARSHSTAAVRGRHPSPERPEASVRPSNGETASGLVRSRKTGATAHVAPRYAGQFQAYIDDLEASGAEVRFMGGYRKGKCWTGGRHPCGMALDVCQLSRGVVDRRCHLPGPAAIFAIAARHGLFEGGGWRSSDYGHAQAGGNDAAAVRFGAVTVASARKHRHVRMARR